MKFRSEGNRVSLLISVQLATEDVMRFDLNPVRTKNDHQLRLKRHFKPPLFI